MTNLSPVAERLAEALQCRCELDILARDGRAVPAQITRTTEEEIREAEVEAIRAMTPCPIKISLNQWTTRAS